MNEKINTDLKSLQFILKKNKGYILPAVVMLISVILLFQFVVPQFGSLIAIQKEAKESSLKLETLKANLDILANVDEDILDSQLNVLSMALPLNKDFVGMLNSVYSSAQKTGVSLGAFSLQIGDISEPGSGDSIPEIKISLPINANIATINNFLETVDKAIPLSEIYSVNVANASSTINMSFYYKPLGASTYNENARISPISQKGLTLINQLSELQNTSSFLGSPIPVASSSAAE